MGNFGGKEKDLAGAPAGGTIPIGNFDNSANDGSRSNKDSQSNSLSAQDSETPMFSYEFASRDEIKSLKVSNEEQSAARTPSTENLEHLFATKTVPMVFRWEGGGHDVYITGTFNRWSEKIPMHRSGNDFTSIQNLHRGKHAYKFIVDDEWRFAPDQPTVADTHGNINNFIDLSNFECSFGNDMEPLDAHSSILDEKLYGRYIPNVDDYTKDPPALPPHLRNIILNTSKPGTDQGNNELQVPQHVTLNHLYCTAIKDGLMVLGVTQRYREKFVTTVYYSPHEPATSKLKFSQPGTTS